MKNSMFIVVLITCPIGNAEPIARSLLEKRVAACVNIIPNVMSLYWWEDKISQDEESLLVVKTRIGRLEDLKKHIKEIHPYNIPEVIALPIVAGLRDYLNWVNKETEMRPDH